MAKSKSLIGKTERILSIYHLLRYCKEVEMKELTDLMPGISVKTFQRDIKLLQSAGVRVKYVSRPYFGTSVMAYVLFPGPDHPPVYPESKAAVRQIDRLIRLMRLMDDMPYEDCDVWYKETFPDISKRTMERDFATLNELGCDIHYKREWEDPEDKTDEEPPGHYYREGVCTTYGLYTFG